MLDAQDVHRHPVNVALLDNAQFGQKAAEGMARNIGSWRFLIIQSCVLAAWIVLNVYEVLFKAWDPYPFILLNLTLSFQAAYTGPILLIAANRSTERDHMVLEHEAEQTAQHTAILANLQDLLTQNTRLTQELHDLTTKKNSGAAD